MTALFIPPRLLPTRVSAPFRRCHLKMPSLACPNTSGCHVAVIGAGAAGLVAARELRRCGHSAVVLERGRHVGGTWIYTPEVEADSLGLDPSRGLVHSSLYASLRTNLPREIMGFRDYPFREGFGEDSRRFPSHVEVLRYLERFARDFDLIGMVRFETEVVEVGKDGMREGKWTVKTSKSGVAQESEVYDAVVVCNGHYTEPRVAEIPDVEAWPGKQMHSHNYRIPDVFLGQVVVLIGSSASAVDISRDISGFAKEVHVASRSDPIETPQKQPGYDNMWLHSMVTKANVDGTVDFKDGSSILADIILHCTGLSYVVDGRFGLMKLHKLVLSYFMWWYTYHFPFLKTGDLVTIDDNRVGPLYKHVFPPSLSPGLSFIGIPWKVIPFPLFELQSKWVAGILSGQCALPSEEEMMLDIKAFYSYLEVSGQPKRYTHNLSVYQFEYCDQLATQAGCPLMEKWRIQMYKEVSRNKRDHPETYRDRWDDDHLVLQARADFRNFHGEHPVA